MPKLGEGSTPVEWYARPIMRTPTEPSDHTGIYQAERRGIKNFCVARVYDKQDVPLIAHAPLLVEARDVLEAIVESVNNDKRNEAMLCADYYHKARALLTKLDR